MFWGFITIQRSTVTKRKTSSPILPCISQLRPNSISVQYFIIFHWVCQFWMIELHVPLQVGYWGLTTSVTRRSFLLMFIQNVSAQITLETEVFSARNALKLINLMSLHMVCNVTKSFVTFFTIPSFILMLFSNMIGKFVFIIYSECTFWARIYF